MSTQHEALERLRKRLDLPEGGKWDYNLARDCWMYTRSTGPNTFTVTAGLVPASETPMTQTMLERAARAVGSVVLGPDERGGPVFPDYYTALELARTVLTAVREPDEAMSQTVRTTEGWEDMIDFVLNEPQR